MISPTAASMGEFYYPQDAADPCVGPGDVCRDLTVETIDAFASSCNEYRTRAGEESLLPAAA
ncbi:hypothetical protein R5H30_09570 [Sulfitobacter sp. D35]|uniref:hypothetical protein n=1 Tax=Sulfitobacter sp. D35 TaxID=3083252 RepID=UPI00296F19E4|nr:hypothetical protein [Sulfitobacter sp. D35]MDW4498227.1 hypothetical protein [Sulfitobacter sp. D35]